MMRYVKLMGWLALPLALACFELAHRFPGVTERWYAQGLYPRVVALYTLANPWTISTAELLLVAVAALAPYVLYRSVRGRTLRSAAKLVGTTLWWGLGVAAWAFLLLWGFNYARPTLAERMELVATDIEASRVLALGRRTAERAASLHGELGQESAAPTELPVSFAELDETVDRLYRRLALPGDALLSPASSARPLASSEIFSHLGISGIFVPFTGEPSVNALQPDAALPLVLAHEKAHQRGITDEGEANFAAFLACAQEDAPLYLRYAAYLFAARYLLGEASRYASEEDVAEAWSLLGEGPLADLRAIREFWERYRGGAMEAASRVNDRYLRAMRVDGGVESYGTVVELLVALEARGEL